MRHARAQPTTSTTTQATIPVTAAPAAAVTATPSAFARETPDDRLPNGTSAYRDTARQPAQPGSVRLVMAGDVMLADGPGQTIANGGDPLALFDAALRSGDYALGNLELPVATVGKPLDSKIFSFRADPQVMRVLKGRFNAMSVANNHSGDYGQAAFLETLQHLATAGIEQVGGGRNLAEAHKPLWIRQNGLAIAVLAYNEFKPRSFEAGPDWPGVAWSEDDRVVADITAARRAGADVIIPFMHWGWERERQPTDRQRQLARLMIDAGADLVVGGHPHVTQGVDTYKGKLIVYSLGNFVFDSFENVPGGQTGWLLRLTLDKNGLLNWDTLTAQMDLAGTPHPVPGAWSPCGQAHPEPARTSQANAHARASGAGLAQRVVHLARCANP
ncbi:MAG: CapA family protein [Burkholderiales bacterium]|nr:CapA family protein [Burkholderiales bacterium]